MRDLADDDPALRRALRPRAMGKFLFLGEEKLYLRGVTYGPLRPGPDGCEFRDLPTVRRDFEQMARNGINSVRTYTVPPRWMLDCAQEHGLWVLVGLPWEQHVAFLHDRGLSRQIEERVRAGVRSCAGHPALLGFAIGNEVPSAVVRWHGHRSVERHIRRLYCAAKAEDPHALVAYVNYPSTEYLDLPFLDLYCFNVYLESCREFDAYLARLQNLAGDKPLILAETGLDSWRHGLAAQARSLGWQVRTAMAAGCAGVFVFAWTDEWYRNEQEVEDWDFGLTRRDRTEKPALAVVRDAFAEAPLVPGDRPLRISVVVCTHNGVRTLDDCLEGIRRLQYPAFETIVVNDGALEGVAAIARRFPVRLLDIPRSGLSAARNRGLEAATGEIIAYLDDDARPDPHWLHYLAHAFATTGFAAVGGPNVPPLTDRWVSECVAHAPGGPIHVLLSDREAEHIPGCNMAFRVSSLRAIGGFDEHFRVAGDDVDICWRFHDAGLEIGFHAGAMVWHHRRPSVLAYWRQQVGYGRAEAMLERKWPGKYNAAGQPGWSGRIYGTGRVPRLSWRRPRIYHGTWGSAMFQSLYDGPPSHFWSLARMPEWYLVIIVMAVLMLLGPLWPALRGMWPLCALTVLFPVTLALVSARRVRLPGAPRPFVVRNYLRACIAALHLLQPLARLIGRVSSGLTPWRRRLTGVAVPVPRMTAIWSERWRAPTQWLESIEAPLEARGATVIRGGDFDRWDLEVRAGVLSSVRLRVLIEEHGAGRQLVRFFSWPRWPAYGVFLALLTGGVTAGALYDRAWSAAMVFGWITLTGIVTTLSGWSGATATLLRVIREVKESSERVSASAEVPGASPVLAQPPAAEAGVAAAPRSGL